MNVEAPKRTLAGVYLLISFVLLGAVCGCEPGQKGKGGAQAVRPERTTVQKVHRFHMRCPVLPPTVFDGLSADLAQAI
jgi:hypothetical protein